MRPGDKAGPVRLPSRRVDAAAARGEGATLGGPAPTLVVGVGADEGSTTLGGTCTCRISGPENEGSAIQVGSCGALFCGLSSHAGRCGVSTMRLFSVGTLMIRGTYDDESPLP